MPADHPPASVEFMRRAITLALDCLGEAPEHDAWWLVEDAASQRRVEKRATEERRRVRMG